MSEVNGENTRTDVTSVDVVVVGAGFAGMYLLHKLRGMGQRVAVLEAGSGVGGTWYWNRYPGARCDIESLQYSYQFDDALQQEWVWEERYAPQPELLRYANHVADRYDLRRDIQFDTRVSSAEYNEAEDTWTVRSENGGTWTARFCIMATGCLSKPNKPYFQGMERFAGTIYHTGLWPHEDVDFTGQRLAVIGTGSSSIQSIPILADQARQLYVFQRTPNYSIPAYNRRVTEEEADAVKADYAAMRAKAKTMPAAFLARLNTKSAMEVDAETRTREFESRWQDGGLPFSAAFGDLLLNRASNDAAADFVREKIRGIVNDPETAEKLCPDTTFAAKRLCVDTDYYATFNQPHVSLISLREDPLVEITENGIRTASAFYEVDSIVSATGFDAMTGALLSIDITGRNGLSLQEKWQDGPRTYLGLTIAGFPNLFTVTGPGSPSVLTNMLVSIEQHVDWICDCITHLNNTNHKVIEAEIDAEDHWVDHVRELAEVTLRSTTDSWYLGANIEGKPRIFMPYIGGFPLYVEKCTEVVEKGYAGFAMS